MRRRTLLSGIACAFGVELSAGLAASLSVGSAGCKDAAPTALRIVSTSPSMTELVFGLGVGDALVGRTTFCDEPPEALKVPTVGGFSNPSLETIVSLRPSLVVGERGPAGPSLPETLGKLGIDTYFPDMRSVAEIRAMILGLGGKLGRGARATEMVKEIDATLDRVAERTRNLPPTRTVFLFDYAPLVAAGPGSFPGELVGLAGGKNLVDTGGQYPKLSAEGLALLDPHVIVDGTNGAHVEPPTDLIRQVPGGAELRAVKANRLVRLPGSAALRPGPRIGKGVEELAKILHPEAFP